MPVIKSRIDVNSDKFKDNKAYYQTLVKQLKERIEQAKVGGSERARKLHKERGRLFVRERIEKVLDPGSFFLEFNPLAAWDMYDNEVPCAGIVTGIGIVSGKECMLIANDPTVKGGTYHPMTVKKHVRAQEIAQENRLPTIYLTDSGGAFLPLQEDVFPDHYHFGRFFYNQAQMSAMGIPQICLVFGLCTAGGAYVPAMSDDVVQVKKWGCIFIGGPPMVKAATGEDIDAEALGGPDVHCRISGVSDYYARDDAHACEICRDIVANLNIVKHNPLEMQAPEEPAYDPEEIYGIINKKPQEFFDMREIIARTVDGSRFDEFKALYGTTLITGFAHINGYPVGILGNNGILFPDCAVKGAHFIERCCQRHIPLLYMHNVMGFSVGSKAEREGIPKHGAKLVMTTANAAVPKFTIFVSGSIGAGNYGMCGRGYQGRLLFVYPSSYCSVMGSQVAAGILTRIRTDALKRAGKTATEEELDKLAQETKEKYDYTAGPYFSTAHLYDDGIIDPVETRKYLTVGISASVNAPIPDTKFGVIRL